MQIRPVDSAVVPGTGWLITLGLVAAYLAFLFWVAATGRMERWNLSLMLGVVLMVRTQHGKGIIEAIAKPKRFWNLLADFGTGLSLLGMALITLVTVFGAYQSLQPSSGIPALGPKEILVIPGLNPFVPLWYGLIGLIVTLVVHEGAHGVLARANNMRVKSLGLLFLVVPVGAFVEPDETELTSAPRRQRMRVFAAGPVVNLVTATVFMTIFAGMMASTSDTPGIHVETAVAGFDGRTTAAQRANLAPGDTFVALDGNHLSRYEEFVAVMEKHRPGDTITLTMQDGSVRQTQLGSRWDALSNEDQGHVLAGDAVGNATCDNHKLSRDPARCGEGLQALAFLGVQDWDNDGFVRHAVRNPFTPGAFALTVYLPVAEVMAHKPELSLYFPSFIQTPFSSAIFWPIAMTVFWIFWLNLLVGLTNILPMLPLDGGHIFRDAVGAVVQGAKPGLEKERRDAVVKRIVTVVSFVILAAIILQIAGPHLVNAFMTPK